MLLSCPLCCKPHFEGVDSLRSSLVTVATAPLTCPVCQETLKGLDKLTIHLFGHVTNSQITSEGDGTSEETSEANKAEIGDSINNIHSGQVQELPSTGPSTLNDPQPNDEEVVTCDICSFTFTDRNILDMHQKLLHQTSPDEKTGKYSYHCHLCSKRFRMRGSLMVHLRVAHYGFNNHIDLPTHLLNNNDAQVVNNTDKNSMDVDLRHTSCQVQDPSKDCKQWSCDVCAKLFTTKYFLKKHKRLHTGEMPYSCSICSKSFTFQQSYHKHMLYHSSEKPYVCNECGRAFKEHSTLQNHARIHSGEKPFGCEICAKRFRQRVSYLVHMRIHTGVMPYRCTACNKSFRYKVSQRSHKCPVNPPGSVVRVSDLDGSDSSSNLHIDTPPKCIMSVDYDTGNINLIPGGGESDTFAIQKHRSNEIFDDRLLPQGDIYSVSLPKVEALCLNSNPPLSPPLEENIQIIREKCLEELFQ